MANRGTKRPTSRRVGKKAYRFNPFPAILSILFLLLVLGVALFLFQKPMIKAAEDLRFEVGSQVSVNDLVLEVKNGTLLNGADTFDSDKAGTKTITLHIRNRLGIDSEQLLKVEFYDATSPVITGPESLAVTVGQEANLLEGVSAVDNSGESLHITVSGEYNFQTPGEYPLFFVTSDSAGNVTRKAFTLTVLNSPFDDNGKMKNGNYVTSKGYSLEIKNGIAYVDGHMIVNKSYSLPRGFSSTGDGTRSMRPEAADAFARMRSAAPAEIQQQMIVKSIVRNIADQTVIFNNYVKRDGLEAALTYSARPGHSEHHTGLAMDLVTSDSSEINDPKCAPALAWLNENAFKYGFILRYPENKENETGYIYEPWHYRYVGVELAEKLYNGGDWITMEDYFGIDSVYRGY